AADQLLNDVVALEAERAGDDLGDEAGRPAGGGEHAVRLAGVHAHACLGQDVLAHLQGGEGDGAVQVRPGAGDDGVDVGVLDEVLPALEGARDAVLPGDGGGRFRPAVADGDDLDAGEGPQPGDVAGAGVAPGPDQADADALGRHGALVGTDGGA